jgi:hypothetical protein
VIIILIHKKLIVPNRERDITYEFFFYGLPEEMFVSISRHIKNIHGVRKDKKQGVRDENYLVDRNEQHYFF